MLGELGRFREKTGSGKVPAGFRESSGNRSGDRLGSRFQEDRFRGSRFQEPVPSLALEVPGTSSGNRLGSTFQEPVPTGLGVRGTGSKVRISSRAGGSGTGSKVPRFQNPPRTVLGTGSGGFRGLDRFPGFEVRIGSRARGSRNRFQGSEVPKTTFRSPYVFFSPTAECYGVSAQYIFRCVLGELGRFREKNGFRESSGRVPGKFRWVPRFGPEVPGFRGSKVPRFREPVPMGSEVWIDSRVPRFQEPVPMVLGTCYDGFRGLDRFQGSKVRELIPGTFDGLR